MNKQIILASTSPRRKELLKLLALKFTAVDSGYDEIIVQHLPPGKLVQLLALGKAKAAAKKYGNSIIIAADTVVVHNGKILGKPKSKLEAEAMLKSFSGKSHFVVSGLVILDSKTNKKFTASDQVKVSFRKISAKEITDYIATGEPFDRAGSYGFQHFGYNLVAKIEGDITTIIGLPMGLLYNGLKKFGVKF